MLRSSLGAILSGRALLFPSSVKLASTASNGDAWKNAKSIYEFRAKDIDGKEVSLDKYKDKVVLITNVACKWGSTQKSYQQFQQLYSKYESAGLRIAAFPCNQFGSQEPWTEPEIKKWLNENFRVTFDLYSKIDVNGDNAHPLWKYLKMKQGGTLFDAIKWNFSKFLIDRSGQPIQRHSPKVEVKDLENEIVKLLGIAKNAKNAKK